MKLGPETKVYKKNKTMLKNFVDNFMLENCDAVVIFSIYGKVGGTPNPDSGCTICKIYVFINGNHLS